MMNTLRRHRSRLFLTVVGTGLGLGFAVQARADALDAAIIKRVEIDHASELRNGLISQFRQAQHSNSQNAGKTNAEAVDFSRQTLGATIDASNIAQRTVAHSSTAISQGAKAIPGSKTKAN